MSLYNNLMKSGFLSKAEEELEEARIVIDKHVENFEDQGLWYFSQEDKEEDFDWLMAEIDGYDVLEEEFEDIINDDVYAIRGYEAGIDFTLMCSVSVDIINKVKEQTLNLSGKIPYYTTKCEINYTDIHIILYTNLIDFPGFNLN